MNAGDIVIPALNRLGLSVNDSGFRSMGIEMLNEICQEHWIYKEWHFRKLNDSITTAVGQAQYVLNKRLGSLSDIINNSFRGSNPVRTIGFMTTDDFYKQHPYQVISGTPYKSYPGVIRNVSNDPLAASVITLSSSFTNYTTGTAVVVQGSNRVVFGGGASIPQNYIGVYVRFGSDQQAYKLVKSDLLSTTIFYLDQPYQGANNATSSFVIGDIQQKATVLGYVGTELVEEEVQLSGSTAVATVASFTTLLSISKETTAGYVTATSDSAATTNLVLDPGETSLTLLSINLYPTPSAIETVTYEFSAQHPLLYKLSDSPLFPAQYYPLLKIDLYIKLMTEWLRQEPSPTVLQRREQLLRNMVDIDNNTDDWKKLQETEYMSTRAKMSNLPPQYGTDYDDQAL